MKASSTLRRLSAAGVLASVAVGFAAHAQVANVATATCAQLLDLSSSDRGQLILWLHGYYAGAAQRPVIDRTRLDETVKAVQEACERNRGMALIGSEVRAIFLGEGLAASQTSPSPALPQGTTQNPEITSSRPAAPALR